MGPNYPQTFVLFFLILNPAFFFFVNPVILILNTGWFRKKDNDIVSEYCCCPPSPLAGASSALLNEDLTSNSLCLWATALAVVFNLPFYLLFVLFTYTMQIIHREQRWDFKVYAGLRRHQWHCIISLTEWKKAKAQNHFLTLSAHRVRCSWVPYFQLGLKTHRFMKTACIITYR